MYEFKVVPFVTGLDKRHRRRVGSLSPAAAAEHLEALISAHASEGWEFWSMERKSVRAPAQFVMWLLGSPPGSEGVDLVILRRQVRSSV